MQPSHKCRRTSATTGSPPSRIQSTSKKVRPTYRSSRLDSRPKKFSLTCKLARNLADRATHLRKYGIGARSNQAHRANYDDQDNGQHNCVLRDVLALFILPKLRKKFSHCRSP